jgi:hypothetical protein
LTKPAFVQRLGGNISRPLPLALLRLVNEERQSRSVRNAIFVTISMLLLAGCATPYGDEGITGGVSENDLGNGKVQIKVVGNDWTSTESMEAMWRQKAATIAATRGSGKYETLQFNVGREAHGLNVLGGAKVARGIIQLK